MISRAVLKDLPPDCQMMGLVLGELADSSCCREDMVQLYWAAVLMLANVSATIPIVFVATAVCRLFSDAFRAWQTGPTGKSHRNIQETLRQALLAGGLGRHGGEQGKQHETRNELKGRQNHVEQRAKAKNSRYYKYK